jgi:membrane-bound lytic murein transglycosylase D
MSAPARAVDPSLHRMAPELFEIQVPQVSAADELLSSGSSAEDVDVKDVRDLGAKLRGDDGAMQPDDLWERIRRGFAMPDLNGPLVVEREAWYASRPEQMAILVQRSRRYLFHIVQELEKRGMPTELALLPMVESAMNPMANSPARASGLWQFIPSTGKQYNLEQNWWYDARRDIVASTNAALDYLQFLHDMYGDWQLALASYNMGENGVMRAIERNRARGLPTDYSSLQIPRETQYYVPKLQALKNIFANPSAFGIDLAPIANAPYFVTVELTRDIDLSIAAKLADMPLNDLIALNPGHNRPMVSTAISPQLILPTDRASVFIANLEKNKKPLSTWQTYVYQRGDKLNQVAAEYGISTTKLRELNHLDRRTRVATGQRLLVPRKDSGELAIVPASLLVPASPASAKAPSAQRIDSYKVRRGDTLYAIAQRFDVEVDDLRDWNDGLRKLQAGDTLRLSAPAQARTAKATSKSSRQKAVTAAASPAKSSSRKSKSSAKSKSADLKTASTSGKSKAAGHRSSSSAAEIARNGGAS